MAILTWAEGKTEQRLQALPPGTSGPLSLSTSLLAARTHSQLWLLISPEAV